MWCLGPAWSMGIRRGQRKISWQSWICLEQHAMSLYPSLSLTTRLTLIAFSKVNPTPLLLNGCCVSNVLTCLLLFSSLTRHPVWFSPWADLFIQPSTRITWCSLLVSLQRPALSAKPQRKASQVSQTAFYPRWASPWSQPDLWVKRAIWGLYSSLWYIMPCHNQSALTLSPQQYHTTHSHEGNPEAVHRFD